MSQHVDYQLFSLTIPLTQLIPPCAARSLPPPSCEKCGRLVSCWRCGTENRKQTYKEQVSLRHLISLSFFVGQAYLGSPTPIERKTRLNHGTLTTA